MSQATHAPSARTSRAITALNIVPSRSLELRDVRRIGIGVLTIQLVVLLVWSGFEAARHVQGADFVGFYQAWYLISHGVLNPPGWWDAQGIFIQWPLAILGLVYAHPITLLVVQDFAIVGAELVAFLWICELVAARETIPLRGYALTGLALLVLNPWIYWSASWDYHSEPLGTLFAILAARELHRGRRIAVIWCVLTLLAGMIPATYLAGMGISLLLTRHRRRAGLAAAGVSAIWFLTLTLLGAGRTIGQGKTAKVGAHGTVSSSLAISARLSTVVPSLVHHSADFFANLAPMGFIGAFASPVIGLAGVVVGENFSQGNRNSLVPSFQGLPLYVFVPVGTVIALMWLNRRLGKRFAHVLAALLVLNVVGWGVIWVPKVVPTWLRVSAKDAAAIGHVQAMIPQRDGVIASQGIVGAFANHPLDKAFAFTPDRLHTIGPYTWVVVAPQAGIEVATVQQSAELLLALLRDSRAKLEYSSPGIWAFRLRVPGQRGLFSDEKTETKFPAALFSTSGIAVRNGKVNSWYMAGSNRAGGPILWGDYYLEQVGGYVASVRLEGSGPATVQAWNDTTNRLLASRQLLVSGSATVSLPVSVSRSDPRRSGTAEHGFGPFQIDPVPAYVGNKLEVKVYSTSGAVLKVKWVDVRRSGRSDG